jgi:NadR type nicotinamide-nucleotide adenylyltransferase
MKKTESFVVIGSECTGKTTLAGQLAEYYGVPFLNEYSRRYAEEKGAELEFEDVLPIAEGQVKAEESFFEQTFRPKIFDTCILSTIIYSKMYYGKIPEQVEAMFIPHRYHHFLLCYPDPEWIDDGIRKMPKTRQEMHLMFEKELTKRNLPFTLIRGSKSERLKAVLRLIH